MDGRGASDAQRLDALLPGLRRRDPEAFRGLYDVMAGPLQAFAHGLVSDRTVAEDVVQDVFLRLTRHVRRFRGDGRSLLAWLYTTTRRRCADHHRGRGRRRERLVAAPPESAAAPPMPDALDPDVEAALAELTEMQRAAIVLRRVHGYDGHEVGEILGVDRDAVYALCARGERRLRALLGTPSDDDGPSRLDQR